MLKIFTVCMTVLIFLSSCASNPPNNQAEVKPTTPKVVNINLIEVGSNWKCVPKNEGNFTKQPNIQLCHFEKGDSSPNCEPSLGVNSIPYPNFFPATCARQMPSGSVLTDNSEHSKAEALQEQTDKERRDNVKPMPPAAFFCTNKSELWKKESYLAGLVACYDSQKSQEGNLPDFQITGHADIRGEDKLNEKLSRKRACEIANYLREQGLSEKTEKGWKTACIRGKEKKYESNMIIHAIGESQPQSNGTSIKDHALNRRVEIVTLYNKQILNQSKAITRKDKYISINIGEQINWSTRQSKPKSDSNDVKTSRFLNAEDNNIAQTVSNINEEQVLSRQSKSVKATMSGIFEIGGDSLAKGVQNIQNNTHDCQAFLSENPLNKIQIEARLCIDR